MAERNTELTFWDHLDELRSTLLRMAGAFLGLAVVLFFFKTFLFENLVLAPTKSDFFLYRIIGTDMDLTLQNIELSAQFFIHIKVCIIYCSAFFIWNDTVLCTSWYQCCHVA